VWLDRFDWEAKLFQIVDQIILEQPDPQMWFVEDETAPYAELRQ
jgi:hypothetical protein